MHAVTFQAPGEVAVEERPEPELHAGRRRDRPGRGERHLRLGPAHLPRPRPVEQGFTIGHEFVGTVIAAGDAVDRVAVGDRVLGTSTPPAATCTPACAATTTRCDDGADVRPRLDARRPAGRAGRAAARAARQPHAAARARGAVDDVALFAGDVMGTGYHAVAHAGVKPGDTVAVLGLGPVGLCAVQAARAAGAARVFAIDTVAERLEMARALRRRRRCTSPRRTRARRCAPPPRAAASTSRSTRSATRRRSRSRQPRARRRHRLGDRRLRRAGRGATGLAWIKGLTLRPATPT